DQEVETQEPEQGPSTEALSNQIKPEEPKSLAWYLDKAIKENKEWATFEPKNWEEWINRNLPPSSEYDDSIKDKNPQVNNLSLSPCPDVWKIDDEPENNKRYIWKKDAKSNWYMEEVNEEEKKENKIIYKPVDTKGMLYQVLINGSEIIEGPPIHSRKNLFVIFSKQKSPQDIKKEIKPEINNDQYCEDSLEDLRDKIIDFLKDEKFMKEYKKEEYNQTDEFQIHEISQEPPKKKLKHTHAYSNLWEAYINNDYLKEIKPILSLDSKPEENLIEVEVSPLQKDLMNTILSYDLNTKSPGRIDKDKEMDFDEESFLNYYDEMSYWKLLTPEEEPDFIILPYIELKDIYFEGPSRGKGGKWFKNIPGYDLSKLDFMELFNEEGIKGNLENNYWEEVFPFDEQTRKALYDGRIWPQEDLNLHNMELLGGNSFREEYGYLFIHKEEGFIRNWKGEPPEERKKGRKILGEIAKDIC
ncbi:hypothetical protein O181_126844, partial [Austropuccinia psidii MF-1]|nr:hypothetical protein [Austropuccinia psidii MF-1]